MFTRPARRQLQTAVSVVTRAVLVCFTLCWPSSRRPVACVVPGIPRRPSREAREGKYEEYGVTAPANVRDPLGQPPVDAAPSSSALPCLGYLVLPCLALLTLHCRANLAYLALLYLTSLPSGSCCSITCLPSDGLPNIPLSYHLTLAPYLALPYHLTLPSHHALPYHLTWLYITYLSNLLKILVESTRPT